MYHSQHLSLLQGMKVSYGVISKKPNGRLEFFVDVVHVIKEQARS